MASFRGDRFFLSNFYPCRVTFHGRTFENSEAAYASEKCLLESDKDRFVGLTGGQAKRLGREVKIRPDWESIKVQVMREVLRAKFGQHSDLFYLLRQTQEKLIEINEWNDTFWGVCKGIGENYLGRLLMEIRDDFRGVTL